MQGIQQLSASLTSKLDVTPEWDYFFPRDRPPAGQFLGERRCHLPVPSSLGKGLRFP